MTLELPTERMQIRFLNRQLRSHLELRCSQKKKKINLYICSGPSSLQKGKLIHKKVLSEPPQVMHDTPWWRSSDLASPLFPRRAETVSWPASLVTACIIQGSLPDELKEQDLAEALCVCVCVCVCVSVCVKCI